LADVRVGRAVGSVSGGYDDYYEALAVK